MRLTLSPVTPALWAGRPRPPSVVVAWQRAPGHRALDAAEWPGGTTRAVLTHGTPLDVEGASAFAIANADAFSSSEADSVIVRFTEAPEREPVAAPDPELIPVRAPEAPSAKPTGNEAIFAAKRNRLAGCLVAFGAPPTVVKVKVELGVVTAVTLDPPMKNKPAIALCLLSEARQWEFFVEKGPARTFVFRYPQDLGGVPPAFAMSGAEKGPMRLGAVSSEADALFEEGKRLMRDKQYPAAKNALEGCVKADPKLADCHKLLGTAWAKLGDPEKGAREYKAFVRLAPPDHPDLDKVKAIISAYESPK